MGYDFHLGKDGPRLIEINTNAGGAFLNAVLARAQRRCCDGASVEPWTEGFERAVIDQFQSEWQAQGGKGLPQRIAIIDDQPEEQYLYPEFMLAQRMLQKNGIDALILSPEALQYEAGVLYGEGKPIDLVYNRLVDFSLAAPAHEALRQAWLHGGAVITPNPRTHALLADKRNLTVLSVAASLELWGLSATDVDLLRESIPTTVRVTADNASTLWQERRQWFFKPVAGHGSKGVYRGSKLTKKTFAQILESDYIAQALVPPSERTVLVNGERETLKVDVRLYTYRGSVLLAAARLYRGQTTNFRTEGGGFAALLLNE
jgi:glutathione synthase/RimK-type ligase-like ATP-grasp enzyme